MPLVVHFQSRISVTDPITLSVSVLALAISATTAWLTLFRRGTVRMTQPTTIFFGPDTPRSGGRLALPKVFLRTLLFATSKRGRIIECMHVSLARNETHQTFNIWVYGDEKLVRGSGLFVGETGIAANHHFLTPDDGNHFKFSSGRYHLHVYARLLGDRTHSPLFVQELEITPDIAAQLEEPGTGIYFDWGPGSARYLPHVEKRPPIPNPEQFFEELGIDLPSGKPHASA
jgi:hypothetical protein